MHWPLALLLSLLTLFQTFPAAAQVDDGLATVRLDGRALFRLAEPKSWRRACGPGRSSGNC